MYASANVTIGVQSKAHGAAKAHRLGETCNAALRPNGLVPEGLFPKRPCAALQSLAGGLPRLRFAPCPRPFEEQRIWHSWGEQALVNREGDHQIAVRFGVSGHHRPRGPRGARGLNHLRIGCLVGVPLLARL